MCVKRPRFEIPVCCCHGHGQGQGEGEAEGEGEGEAGGEGEGGDVLGDMFSDIEEGQEELMGSTPAEYSQYLLGLQATPPPPGYGLMEEVGVVPEVEQVQGGGVVEEQAEGGAQWFKSITFSQLGLICKSFDG